MVNGWIACGAAENAAINPQAREAARVTATSRLDDSAARRTCALFGVDEEDDRTARDLVPVLEGLPRAFVLVRWPLGA